MTIDILFNEKDRLKTEQKSLELNYKEYMEFESKKIKLPKKLNKKEKQILKSNSLSYSAKVREAKKRIKKIKQGK